MSATAKSLFIAAATATAIIASANTPAEAAGKSENEALCLPKKEAVDELVGKGYKPLFSYHITRIGNSGLEVEKEILFASNNLQQGYILASGGPYDNLLCLTGQATNIRFSDATKQADIKQIDPQFVNQSAPNGRGKNIYQAFSELAKRDGQYPVYLADVSRLGVGSKENVKYAVTLNPSTRQATQLSSHLDGTEVSANFEASAHSEKKAGYTDDGNELLAKRTAPVRTSMVTPQLK